MKQKLINILFIILFMIYTPIMILFFITSIFIKDELNNPFYYICKPLLFLSEKTNLEFLDSEIIMLLFLGISFYFINLTIIFYL